MEVAQSHCGREKDRASSVILEAEIQHLQKQAHTDVIIFLCYRFPNHAITLRHHSQTCARTNTCVCGAVYTKPKLQTTHSASPFQILKILPLFFWGQFADRTWVLFRLLGKNVLANCKTIGGKDCKTQTFTIQAMPRRECERQVSVYGRSLEAESSVPSPIPNLTVLFSL